MIPRLVVATHNHGKVKEFAALLRPYVVDITSAASLGLPAPEETGSSFAENAILKARSAALATDSVAVADDSGLCVKALGGKPGIFSARWAGQHNNFTGAMQRVQDELGNSHDRSAYFICVLALAWPNGRCETVEGRIEGTILPTPRGRNGHGYDPIFQPAGATRSFAEMSDREKNAVSHRGIATRRLVEKFFAAQ